MCTRNRLTDTFPKYGKTGDTIDRNEQHDIARSLLQALNSPRRDHLRRAERVSGYSRSAEETFIIG